MSADAVEDHAWGRIVTDAPLYRPSRISMTYEPAEDPRTVRFVLPSGMDWTFPRELLERGLRSPARSGDVEIWPCGRVQTIVEFHSPDGVTVVQFDAYVLRRFLRHTYAVGMPTIS
ncbi:SsgA family sporulation/cell division regulator [Streptomyces sp. NPDC004838]